MKADYTKMPDRMLREKLVEMKMERVRTSNVKLVESKGKPENFSRVRREIARIKTEINRRKKIK